MKYIAAIAKINGTEYQWLAWRDETEGFVKMFQQDNDGSWTGFGVINEPLRDGSLQGLVDETVATWLAYSEENGHTVERVA